MDAAVKPNDRTRRAGRPGRIIVVRHGKPNLDRNAGPRLDWRSYRDWWARYEVAPLAEGQKCPPDLLNEVSDDAIVLSSVRPRAMQTADQMARGRDVKRDAVFNEATLPPPHWKIRRLPRTWNWMSRVVWMLGHADPGDENVKDARARASRAADILVKTVEGAEGRDVVLAAHGWFNRMLRPQLKRRGWVCIRDGGDKYWSYRIYQKK
jgi:broad specificity phosphatase PhoE